MGGATRFMALLTTPIPQLRPSFILLRRISSISVAPRRLLTLSSPSKTQTPIPPLVNCLHSQPTNTAYAIQSSAAQYHPWTEWTNFLNILSNEQGLSALEEQGITPGDEFVVYEELSDDFVRASSACIAFARARPNLLRLLSRRDIELVVANGTPFLFKSALDTARRMRAFLGTDGNVPEVDKANTVDLMKYILSYTSNPTASPERKGLYSRELVDSSIRNLLQEMCTVCSGAPTGYNTPASRQSQMTFGHNIEMKRGDWICQKCNFMNFAKNVKCLECEETRPKKQLTGGEWECPQCNFFNYGRNTVCLRCDCRRPGPPLFSNRFNSGENSYNKPKTDEGKAQQWFSKISQLNRMDDDTNSAAVVDKDIKVVSEEGNRFVVSQKKDNPLTSPKYRRQVASDQANKDDFVPFVPFPPGYFSKKEGDTNQPLRVKLSTLESTGGNPDGGVGPTESKWSGKSLEGSGEKEVEPLDMSEEAKAERWFKRVAQIKDISELSQIPDEDFPSIMPMRKGVNRFVVSKRKTPLERRLTSQQHRRNLPVVSSDSVEE